MGSVPAGHLLRTAHAVSRTAGHLLRTVRMGSVPAGHLLRTAHTASRADGCMFRIPGKPFRPAPGRAVVRIARTGAGRIVSGTVGVVRYPIPRILLTCKLIRICLQYVLFKRIPFSHLSTSGFSSSQSSVPCSNTPDYPSDAGSSVSAGADNSFPEDTPDTCSHCL